MKYEKSYMSRKADSFAARGGNFRRGGFRIDLESMGRHEETLWNFHFCPYHFPLVHKLSGGAARTKVS